MRRKIHGYLLLVSGSLPFAVPAFGHHSYQAEFDQTKCTNIVGTLTKVEWDNPHIYFHMDAKDAGGKMTAWTFEGHSLPALQRNGTHRVDFTDNIGKVLNVRACLAKNGGPRAAAETITTPDGRVHVVGVNVEHGDAAPQDSYRAHSN